MKPRFTDEQVIHGPARYCVAISRKGQKESGDKTADVCRRHGISSATLDKYKSKYGGMVPSDAKLSRAVKDENGKLKKLLAEQMVDNTMLRDVNSKNSDARRKAKSCGSSDGGSSSQPATGVRGVTGCSVVGALSIAAR